MTCNTWLLTCNTWLLTYNTWLVTCNTWLVTCNTCLVTCNTWHVYCRCVRRTTCRSIRSYSSWRRLVTLIFALHKALTPFFSWAVCWPDSAASVLLKVWLNSRVISNWTYRAICDFLVTFYCCDSDRSQLGCFNDQIYWPFIYLYYFATWNFDRMFTVWQIKAF